MANVTLALSDFATDKGETLTDWSGITTLQIDPPAEGVPLYKDFHWE